LLFYDQKLFVLTYIIGSRSVFFTAKTRIVYLEMSVFVTVLLHVSNVVIKYYLVCAEMFMTAR